MTTMDVVSPSPSRMSITPRRRRSDASQLPETQNGNLALEEEEVSKLEEEVVQMERRIADFKESCQAAALKLQDKSLDKYLASTRHDNHSGRTAERQGLQTNSRSDLEGHETTEKFRNLFERRTVARAQMAQIVDRTTELAQILHIQLAGTPAIDSPLSGQLQ